MEHLIVEELCNKYGKSENLIKMMLNDTTNEGYNIEESVKMISDFYDKKVCNKVCSKRDIFDY